MTKELYDFACLVYWMRQAEMEYQKLRYSPNFNKRGEAGEQMRDLQRRVDAEIKEICQIYEEEYL